MLNRRLFRKRAFELSQEDQLELEKFNAMLAAYGDLQAKVLPKQKAIEIELEKYQAFLESLAFPTDADKALLEEVENQQKEILKIADRLEQLDYNVESSKTGASKVVKRAYKVVSLEIKPNTTQTKARKTEDIYKMLDKVTEKLKELGMNAEEELEAYIKDLREMVTQSVKVKPSVKEKLNKGEGDVRVQEELESLEKAISEGKNLNSSITVRRMANRKLDRLYMNNAINDRQYIAFRRCASRNAIKTIRSLRNIQSAGIIDSIKDVFTKVFEGIISFGKSIFGYFKDFNKELTSINDDLAEIDAMLR